MKIITLETSGFLAAKWFNDDTGVRFKNNRYEVTLTIGNQKKKYIGRYENLELAKYHRREFLTNLFLENLSKNSINPENVKETEYENYFATTNGFILNKFGNILVGCIDRCGYKEISIKNKSRLVHRIILKTFNNIENSNLLDVNHKDGNKINNSIENLEWTTRSENIIHSYRNGLQNNVAGRPVVKEEQIKIFKQKREEGKTYKQIAKETGFNEKTIRNHCNK